MDEAAGGARFFEEEGEVAGVGEGGVEAAGEEAGRIGQLALGGALAVEEGVVEDAVAEVEEGAGEDGGPDALLVDAAVEGGVGGDDLGEGLRELQARAEVDQVGFDDGEVGARVPGREGVRGVGLLEHVLRGFAEHVRDDDDAGGWRLGCACAGRLPAHEVVQGDVGLVQAISPGTLANW